MTNLIREKDWSVTPLGPIEHWPSTLSATVNVILGINFPIIIGWGKDLISIYNDAYRSYLGDKPEALGRPFLEVWNEAKEIIEPQIYRVLSGEALFFKNTEFNLTRGNKPQRAWFDYSFSPLQNSEGEIRGIINVAVEVTSVMQAKMKLKEINQMLEQKVKERTSELEKYRDQLQSLTYQLNLAKDNERHDIARYLHDNVGQLLSLSIIKLDQLKKTVHGERLIERINDLKEVLLLANEYTRDFVHELKPPPILEKQNTVESLEWLAKKFKKYELDITLDDDGQQKQVSEETHQIIFESVRELCFNIIKHADVDEATLKIRKVNNHLQIIVEDNGKGFDQQEIMDNLIQNGFFGLFNTRERLKRLGGSLEIQSEPGKGTKAILHAPLTN